MRNRANNDNTENTVDSIAKSIKTTIMPKVEKLQKTMDEIEEKIKRLEAFKVKPKYCQIVAEHPFKCWDCPDCQDDHGICRKTGHRFKSKEDKATIRITRHGTCPLVTPREYIQHLRDLGQEDAVPEFVERVREEGLGECLKDISGIPEAQGKIVQRDVPPERFKYMDCESHQVELCPDRENVQPGDTILFMERDSKDEYTGNAIKCHVQSVTRNCPERGLMDGYCIIEIDRKSRITKF